MTSPFGPVSKTSLCTTRVLTGPKGSQQHLGLDPAALTGVSRSR
jgi:hypothetical protein